MSDNSLLEKISGLHKKLESIQDQITDPSIMSDMKKDVQLRETAKEELAELEERLPSMEEEIRLLLIPADPEDSKNAIVEIRGGTGGDEAAIFAGDLFRMYSKFIERKGWKLEVTSQNEGAAGGFKEIIFKVKGDGVYGVLKYESGVHRVQRV